MIQPRAARVYKEKLIALFFAHAVECPAREPCTITLENGTKRANAQLLEGFRVHYNHVRPHEGLGGTAPGEAAGITVNGPKWLTLTQHASLLKNTG